jgi:ABC-type methionine transport system ATPase subunit
MLNNNFNFHTWWDLQNPYIPRFNKKQALWASSKKKQKNSFQHYNILSAYEVKDEISTGTPYISLVFYQHYNILSAYEVKDEILPVLHI